MKYSISIVEEAGRKSPFVLRGDYYKSISLARNLGYEGVELHIRKPDSIDACKFKDYCDREKIAVSSIGTGMSYSVDGLTFMSRDKDTRLFILSRMKEYIQLAEYLDAVVIIGLIKGIVPQGQDYAQCEARVTDMLNRCLEDCEKRNVTMVMEAINRYETNFLSNIGQTMEYVGKFKSGHLKVHIDSFHMNIEEANFEESILKCSEVLGHVHFADSDRMYPGHGHICFKEIIDAIEKTGYSGFAAIECLPEPEPEEAARRTINYLRSLQ